MSFLGPEEYGAIGARKLPRPKTVVSDRGRILPMEKFYIFRAEISSF